jgi:hypothetical protein
MGVLRFAWLVLFGAMAWGCGSRGNDDIPKALLEAIAEGNQGTSEYPSGPYGSEVGDVAGDVCVDGWRNPSASDFDPAALERVCFSDFWDPTGDERKLLLVNTSAVWCQACRSEYGGTSTRPSLVEEAAARQERGLRVMGVLFQKLSRMPADETDASLWAETFEVDFPFGVDAPFAMGAFADPELQPFNMLLDTQTMTIALKIGGDEPKILWPAIDDLLE